MEKIRPLHSWHRIAKQTEFGLADFYRNGTGYGVPCGR